MAHASSTINVYLTVGTKRTFASAVDWPGWDRGGRDEASALQGLRDYGPRYAHALSRSRLGFHAPDDDVTFTVVERLEGTSSTDFGIPDMPLSSDAQPVSDDELRRLQSLLRAVWRTFDHAANAAEGKELRKGPRGGGRDLAPIVEHVVRAEQGYLARLAWPFKMTNGEALAVERDATREATLNALAAAVHNGLPDHGPRGGQIWLPRYFVRRVAWHVLDHAWEIEDRCV